jgi:hypothetical protein
MSKNSVLKALKETIFYCAVLHLVLLGVYVIMSGDWTYFNVASIFDLRLFFPRIDYGSLTVAAVSALPVLLFFIWQYFRLGGKSKLS